MALTRCKDPCRAASLSPRIPDLEKRGAGLRAVANGSPQRVRYIRKEKIGTELI
jgi:hypothetical protein